MTIKEQNLIDDYIYFYLEEDIFAMSVIGTRLLRELETLDSFREVLYYLGEAESKECLH